MAGRTRHRHRGASCVPVTQPVLLIRHGESEWNVARRTQGQTRHPRLTAQGREQASRAADLTARVLAERGAGGIRVVSSDLVRARQTADVVAERLGAPVREDQRLREMALGSLEGLGYQETWGAGEQQALGPGLQTRRSGAVLHLRAAEPSRAVVVTEVPHVTYRRGVERSRISAGRRRGRTGVIVALLLAVGLLPGLAGSGATPSAAAATAAVQGSIELAPRDYIAGERLTITGSLGVPGVRPIVLQRWMRDRYLDSMRGRTAADGSFAFTVRGPGMATPFSVYAPDLEVRTPRAPVAPQDQVVTVAPRRTKAVAGKTIRISVTTAPIREGRRVVLQERVSPTEWQRVGRATTGADGRVRFRITPQGSGTVTYRAVARPMSNGIAAFPSFPKTFQLSAVPPRAADRARAPRDTAADAGARAARTAYTQPGPIHAGNTFGWYPLKWSHDWEWGEPVGWRVGSDGSGRVSIYRAMLALDSGPTNRAQDNHGSVATVRRGKGQPYGRWEIRLRAPRWSNGAPDHRVVAELVPAGTEPDACSDTAITMADFAGYGRTIVLGASHAGRSWARTQRGVVRNRDNWHTYAVEVTPERISWFVDAKPVATLADPAALSGEPLTMRLSLIAPEAGTPMSHTRAGVDWVRHWTLAKPGTGRKRIERAPAPEPSDSAATACEESEADGASPGDL